MGSKLVQQRWSGGIKLAQTLEHETGARVLIGNTIGHSTGTG